MKNSHEIKLILKRMAVLLRLGNCDDWATAVERFHNEIGSSYNATTSNILGMFGGMGSLNDIILYKDGQPLSAENAELDFLRSSLYQLCH